MSINVYLKGEEVRNINGFETVARHDREDGQTWNEYRLPGICLSYTKGRWHIFMSEPTEPIPELIKEIVEEITFHNAVSGCSMREFGFYKHKTAEAEVNPYASGRERGYFINVRAKKMEDVLELYRQIKAGTIRPEISYEGVQGGLSNRELHSKLASAAGTIKKQRADLQLLEESQDHFCQLAEKQVRINGEQKEKFSRFLEKLSNLANDARFWNIRKRAKALVDELAVIQ